MFHLRALRHIRSARVRRGNGSTSGAVGSIQPCADYTVVLLCGPPLGDPITHYTRPFVRPSVPCCITLKNATAYTSVQKLLNKSAMHAVSSLLLQSRKFW